LDSLSQLHTIEFKTLLSYINDAAKTLTTSTRKLSGFQLSSLSQLMDVKSPTDKTMTVLHSLITLIEEKSPEVLDFGKKNQPLFVSAIKAMANFQSFFPKIIQKLWLVEGEYHSCSDSDFKEKLENFRNILIEGSESMNSKLLDIDTQIVFFGNNENQLPSDSTITEIKRLWIELRDLGIFPGSECIKRAKRDEDRYTFFVTIEMFFRDVNKARSFVLAKKDKVKQKEAYLKEVETKEKEEENHKEAKRNITKEVTDAFVKPLRKTVHRSTTSISTAITKQEKPHKRKSDEKKEGTVLRKNSFEKKR